MSPQLFLDKKFQEPSGEVVRCHINWTFFHEKLDLCLVLVMFGCGGSVLLLADFLHQKYTVCFIYNLLFDETVHMYKVLFAKPLTNLVTIYYKGQV